MIDCPDINHLTSVHALYVDMLFVGDIRVSMPHNHAHPAVHCCGHCIRYTVL